MSICHSFPITSAIQSVKSASRAAELTVLSAFGPGPDLADLKREAKCSSRRYFPSGSPEEMGVSREPFTQTNLASLKEEFCLNIGELDRIDKSSELPKAFGGQSLSGDAAGKRFDKSGIEIQSKASDASADHFTTQDLITT